MLVNFTELFYVSHGNEMCGEWVIAAPVLKLYARTPSCRKCPDLVGIVCALSGCKFGDRTSLLDKYSNRFV